MMTYNEGAVFKWVLIIAGAAISAIVLVVLISPLVGALWALALAIAGCVYGYRWARESPSTCSSRSLARRTAEGSGAMMTYNEGAVFKWVLIIAGAAISAIVLVVLISPLVGALWALALAIAGCVYGYRWAREWWENARDRPGGPDHKP